MHQHGEHRSKDSCLYCQIYSHATQQDYNLEEGSDEVILKSITKLRDNETGNFGNARSVSNYFENVITNQANRLMSDSGIASDTDELMLIKCIDLDM